MKEGKSVCGECEEKERVAREVKGMVGRMLWESLEDMNQLYAVINTTFNELIQSTYRHKLSALSSLSSYISSIHGLISFYLSNSAASLRIDSIARTAGFPELLQPQITLFSYIVDTEEIEMKLNNVISIHANAWLFETEEPPPKCAMPKKLPIFGQYRQLYDPVTRQMTLLSAPDLLLHPQCTSWTYIDPDRLLLCGEKTKRAAYILALSDCSLLPTAASVYIHSAPGLVASGSVVYQFGGLYRSLPQKYSEKYYVSEDRWVALPCMQFPRSHFQPALLSEKAYIVGGQWANTAELFDMRRERFETLMLELPATGSCFVAPFDGDLLVFHWGKVEVWEVSVGSQYLRPVLEHTQTVFRAYSAPVRVGDKLYFLGNEEHGDHLLVLEFELSTKGLAIVTIL